MKAVIKNKLVVKIAVPLSFKSNLFMIRALISVPKMIDSKAMAPVKTEAVDASMSNWYWINSVIKPKNPFNMIPSVTVDKIIETRTKFPSVFLSLFKNWDPLCLQLSLNFESFLLKPLSFESTCVVVFSELVGTMCLVFVNDPNENINVIIQRIVQMQPFLIKN